MVAITIIIRAISTAIIIRAMWTAVVTVIKPFVPTGAMAAMVLMIKNLVITVTKPVVDPVGILSMKTCPVMRVSLIPRIPPGRIPVIRSDD
jgi:hypothetical protein